MSRTTRPPQSCGFQTRLPGDASAIPRFEDWLDRAAIPDPRLRDRVRLAGLEILDNLIRHASPLEGDTVRTSLRLRAGGGRLVFSFRSEKFRSFSRGGKNPRTGYDIEDGRWRGLGLVMVGFLTLHVRYVSDRRSDRVEAEF